MTSGPAQYVSDIQPDKVELIEGVWEFKLRNGVFSGRARLPPSHASSSALHRRQETRTWCKPSTFLVIISSSARCLVSAHFISVRKTCTPDAENNRLRCFIAAPEIIYIRTREQKYTIPQLNFPPFGGTRFQELQDFLPTAAAEPSQIPLARLNAR